MTLNQIKARKELIRRLKLYRAETGKSQFDVALEIGLNTATINVFERGLNSQHKATIRRIEKYIKENE